MKTLPDCKIRSGGHSLQVRDGGIVIPWTVACALFQYHVVGAALKDGKTSGYALELLHRGRNGEMVEELQVYFDKILTDMQNKITVTGGYQGRNQYEVGIELQSPENPLDGPEFDESIKDTQRALTQITEDLKSRSWNRSEPTQEGGLMVGPGSPLYGRRVMCDPKELLASLPPEMIDQMGDELAEVMRPTIKGVIAGDGVYIPAAVDDLTHEEVVQLGLVYDIYPAGHVPVDERENLHDWMMKNQGSLGWHASAQTKENIAAIRKNEIHIRDMPGAYLALKVATNAPFWGDQKRQANKRNQEE